MNINKLNGYFLTKIVLVLFSFSFLLGFGLMGLFFILESQLPDVETLKDVQLQEPLRIYSKDKKLIAEFGQKRRIPVTLDQIPQPLIKAILATEDQRFYDHPGVDFLGLVRAFIHLAKTGEKSQGASTITMQVARNFFLSRKKTYIRKINEILLAIKIDRELSKEKILELYLNKIYFGYGAYGVAAAAQVYYGKLLNELTLPEMAMIAGLPKAPSKINPIHNLESAIKRRNHVLERMHEDGYITKADYDNFIKAPETASYHGRKAEVYAPYAAEIIRQGLYQLYGEAAYTKGLRVITTVDSELQQAANEAVIASLLAYDKRHGYRGPITHIPDMENAVTTLSLIPRYHHLQPAVVTQIKANEASVRLKNHQQAIIKFENMQWARPSLKNGQLGAKPKSVENILKVGDLIYVIKNHEQVWELSQIPEIEGAMTALDPENGAVLALVGGFHFKKSNYNRITQATRQPGSCFKPLIYAGALEKGYTLASIINDAPIVLEDISQDNYMWRPQNNTNKFYGPTRLKVALTQSRNLVSIRLLQSIGIDYAINYIEKFGFLSSAMPKSLSLALGTAEVTPLQLTTAFATFANGGYKINPYLIDSIEDNKGEVLVRSTPQKACIECNSNINSIDKIPNAERAEQIISPQVAYLINSALKSTIQEGTAIKAKALKRSDLAGKTGTTNDKMDAWFIGFNTRIVATAWMGFDQPAPIFEYGSQAALPMWIEFMTKILKFIPESHLPEPPGLVTVRIDPVTGLLANTDNPQSIFEIFQQDTVPMHVAPNTFSQDSSQGYQQEDAVEKIEHLF